MEKIKNKSDLINWKKSKTGSILGSGMIYTMFGLFFLAGAWGLWSITAVPVYQLVQARSWVKTPALVTSTELIVHYDDECNTYSPQIKYEYEYQGKKYKSERYNFNPANSSQYMASQVVQSYPEGLTTECFVNPSAPSEAVLDRGPFRELLWGLLPLIFFLIGSILPVALIFHWKHKNQNRETKGINRIARWDTNIIIPIQRHHQTDQGFQLKASSPRWLVFTGVLLMTLFWNGILSVFYMDHYHDYITGAETDWWGLAFLSFLFLPIGLLFVAGTIKTFLMLFSPRPVLTVNQLIIPLGHQLQIGWNFKQGADSLEYFSLSLVGMESSTDSRGESNDTQNLPFFEKMLFHSDQPQEIQKGQREITIPENLMHSFDSEYNRIQWNIVAEGEVRFLPNFKDKFGIIVLPKEGHET